MRCGDFSIISTGERKYLLGLDFLFVDDSNDVRKMLLLLLSHQESDFSDVTFTSIIERERHANFHELQKIIKTCE